MISRCTLDELKAVTQCDLLSLTFNQACLRGELDVAASVLRQLDALLLGGAMAWGRREAALKRIRLLRHRLDVLRDEARGEQAAEHERLVA